MSRLPMVQAVAADYADAMLVARRAKNWLVFFLSLILLIQLGVFFAARYVPGMKIRGDAGSSAAPNSMQTPRDGVLAGSSSDKDSVPLWVPILEELIDATVFLGIMLAIVLPIILLLILTIMLVGRLVGVSHVTGAFCWAIVFLIFLFPWQSLLNHDVHTLAVVSASPPASQPSIAVSNSQDVRIPGVLYTFPELRRHYDFDTASIPVAVLGWGRYVGMPMLELIILLAMVQARSRKGLRLALGEAEVQVDPAAAS